LCQEPRPSYIPIKIISKKLIKKNDESIIFEKKQNTHDLNYSSNNFKENIQKEIHSEINNKENYQNNLVCNNPLFNNNTIIENNNSYNINQNDTYNCNFNGQYLLENTFQNNFSNVLLLNNDSNNYPANTFQNNFSNVLLLNNDSNNYPANVFPNINYCNNNSNNYNPNFFYDQENLFINDNNMYFNQYQNDQYSSNNFYNYNENQNNYFLATNIQDDINNVDKLIQNKYKNNIFNSNDNFDNIIQNRYNNTMLNLNENFETGKILSNKGNSFLSKKRESADNRKSREIYEKKYSGNGSGNLDYIKKGDWVCMKCSNINFSYRRKCHRCKSFIEDVGENINGK